jgi:hypothetical protein
MLKHTARAEGANFIRHFVNGEQVAVVASQEWDGYVRSVWSLDPSVVALQPARVADFPGDASSGTPATLETKESRYAESKEETSPAEEERAIQEAEEVSGKPS